MYSGGFCQTAPTDNKIIYIVASSRLNFIDNYFRAHIVLVVYTKTIYGQKRYKNNTIGDRFESDCDDQTDMVFEWGYTIDIN